MRIPGRIVAPFVACALGATALACSPPPGRAIPPKPGTSAPPPDAAALPTTTTTTTVATTATVPTTTTTTAPTTTLPPTTLPPSPLGPVPIVHRVPTTDPVVFVTIDDGHNAAPDSLAYLLETDMPISMFLNEGPVRAQPEYFQALVGRGNQVHSHTRRHPFLRRIAPGAQYDEVCGMVDVLRDVYGQAGTLFRAPYGESDATTAAVAGQCGLTAIMHWSGIVEHGVVTLQSPPLRAGDVLLLHFGPSLLGDLVAVEQAAAAAGLQIARLEDYL